ncbi:TRAP transporter large permease subunit [Virgibacillus halophilus]|uniref:TRAP transporter large permease subunit n=1 Tax=Tigheibacillus halophilus TaxID=361280 RepID=A0ABU5C2K5_9BACI|nr:TRAP transporter large permease subunit [Virgibacillus halophilus]
MEKASWKHRWMTLRKAVWGGILPILILGSIYSGAATPTESSIIASAYAIVVSLFVYKETSLKLWHKIFRETIGVTAMIMLIIASAMLFSLYLTQEQIPQQLATAMLSMPSLNVVLFFVLTAVLFLVLGTFLESSSIILITLPLLMPIMLSLDVNPIHFAVVMIVNMEIAQVTPPVGLNLFVISGITKEKLGTVFYGAVPFTIVMALCMIIIMIWPGLALWLPDTLFGKS